ncbi:MAG TPA: rhodanese-like domain-containing protein [Opitutaceae bacterium]|nr:rhodanese-like domain-containing protein [Opitutaceae bacterium]
MTRDEARPPGVKTCRQIALLLAFALVPALLAGWLHPKRPAWGWKRPAVAEIALEDAQHLPPPVIWVDARPEVEYQERHVPGAISLDQSHWEELLPDFIKVWQPGTRVVVYCNTQECDASHEVALRLHRELQIDNVFVLQGGWKAWLEAQKK